MPPTTPTRRFTELGRQFAIGGLVGTLAARLRAEAGWRARPECRAIAIRRPLVITGIPRTGTTALHKLLSMDPQFQGLEHWLAESPMVRPPRSIWESNPAYRASVAALEAYFKIMPEMRKAHDMVADEVDECLDVLRQSFVSNHFGASTYIPSYDDWFFRQDEQASYRRYADVLRLIGADEPDRRWLLKNPGHIAEMQCLLEVFPGCAHRADASRSGEGHPLALQYPAHGAPHVRGRCGARRGASARASAPYWRRAVDRTDAAAGRAAGPVLRRRSPAVPLPIRSAPYARMYAYFDLRLSRWRSSACGAGSRQPDSRHGEHRYRLEDYGVSERQIRDSFAGYCARHALH